LDDESKSLCWEYLDELNKTAYEAISPSSKWATVPSVPSREDIQVDIMKRRKNNSSSETEEMSHSVQQGVKDIFQKICSLRNITEDVTVDVASEIERAIATKLNGYSTTIGEMCGNKEPRGFFEMMSMCQPNFDCGEEAPSDEVWELVEKCIALTNMKSAIPTPMMSGIEKMANRIVSDLAAGKTDMNNISMGAISQEVMSNVSPSEMNEFANNIDKILPALGHLRDL